MTLAGPLEPTEKLEISPLEVKAPSILLNASIAKTEEEREDHLDAPHENSQRNRKGHH